MIESTITNDLEKFANQIQEKTIQAKKEGKLVPISQEYMVMRLDNFEYTNSGVKSSGATGESFTRDNWIIATRKIFEFFQESKEYKELQTKLKTAYPEYQEYFLDNFITVLAERFIDGEISTQEQKEFVQKFEKEIEEGHINKAIAELDGIILEPESISLNKGIVLRQTKRSDLEQEENVSFHGRRNIPYHSYPSAILTIESSTTHDTSIQDMDIQKKIHKIIPILRLFKVGSVKFYEIRSFSESITSMQGVGTQWSGEQFKVLEKYLVNNSDEKILRNFYKIMEEKIPESFIHPTPDASYKDIAYHRYEDALMTNGTIERRIANGIMGLESIFLREQEQQELSYRLRLRVARLMGFFDFDPLHVKRKVRDAYSIRSTFVHGGLMSHDAESDIKEKHDSVKSLLLEVLNYLRISIVTSIFMNTSKPHLLDTLDNSFLDKRDEEHLKQLVSQTRQIFGFKD